MGLKDNKSIVKTSRPVEKGRLPAQDERNEPYMTNRKRKEGEVVFQSNRSKLGLVFMLILAGFLISWDQAFCFDELPIKGTVNMIDFGAATCIPCKMMEPIMKELHAEYKGRAAVILVDIRYNSDLARQYRIRGIPTQVFFDKDGNEVYRHVGFMDKESIVKRLDDMGVPRPDSSTAENAK